MNRKKLILFGGCSILLLGSVWLGFQSQYDSSVYKTKNPIHTTQPAASAVVSHGSYVTYGEYLANTSAYTQHKRIYFFRTDWCFICKVISAEARANIEQIPENVVVIEVDFDTQTYLRTKYGVTTQTTFVQVAADGTQLGQWHAQNFREAIAHIR